MVAKNVEVKSNNGLLPTPSMPKGLPKAQLTDNARQVLMKRYVRRGDDGKPAENVEEMFWRVAYHVAKVEQEWGADIEKRAVEYYHLLSSKKFFPNSPTFTGAGTPLGQLAACFVLPITDDMGRDAGGIFQTLRDAALIQQTGGGNGFSFSRLRPHGSMVLTSAGQATGPVGFLKVYDQAFGEIAQGGCLLPDTLVFTNKGLLRLDEIVNTDVQGWQEHDLSVPTDTGVKDSPRGFNNGIADVLRVHTREGLSIAGTPNHKVKAMTENGPQWKELQDLAQGDWIIMRLGEQTGKIQVLNKPTQKHGNQVMPELPSILDEEFAFFLGYLAGDGFMAKGEDDHRVGVSVAHSSYLMEEMPLLLERLFSVNVQKMQKSNDRSVTFVMDNRAIKEFLVLNGLKKQGSRDVTVPRMIRQSPQNIVGAYLRGLFEADGTLTYGYPNLGTSSARLAREVSTLLIGIGCPVQMRTTSAGLDRYGDSDTYHVKITSTVGLQVWREKIGCDQRSRFVSAYSWESDQRRESSYVLPNPAYWLQPVLDAITVGQIDDRGRGRNINFRSTEPHLRRQVLRYMRDDRNLTRSGYDLLKSEHPDVFENAPSAEGYWFVEVRGVEEAGRSLTLDLEVAENHTYLAYGMVTHNTRRGANMAVLRVDHPDVEEFITCKINENQITNFNISVGITDAFMRAVKNNEEWPLRFPDLKEMKQKRFSGTLEQAEAAGITINTYKTINARELFNKIVKQAHHNGEPGMLFLDAANRGNPVPHLYPLEATNPCVTGDTLIYTDQGLRRADELAAAGQEINVTSDARFGTDTFLPATHVFQTGTKPVVRLMTREGYELRLTEDHRVMTSRGWVEAGKLQSGDRVHILNRKGGFGEKGTLEEGRVLGWLVGDGTVNVVRAVLSFFGDEKQELAPAFAEMVTNLVEKPGQHRAYPVGVVHVDDRDEARVASDRLRDWVAQYGITEKSKHFVPFAVFAGSEGIQRGFLQALFTADGQVNDGGEKGCSVRLSSSHLILLKDVQRLLLNFGIASRIYENRRLGGLRPMPDGKGGTKDYFHLPQHDLAVSKTNLIRFANEIGFLTEAKQTKLADYLSRMIRGPYEEPFLATIQAIEPDGVEPVYDLHQPDTNSFIANGFVVHNCGEQWLGPYENCCLGSINLNEHCGPNGSVDWESLRRSVVTSTRFLDDVVEANAYVPAVPQLTEAAHKARRIGLGIMGLADLMYHVGVRYGSQEGQEFGAQIMEFVRYHAMKTSVELAEERGPFPAIEGSIYDMDDMKWEAPKALMNYQNNWSMPEVKWDSIVSGIKNHGIRNAAQTTVAPTGTIATVAGCEGYGCEPVFALAYIRHVNDNGKDLKLTYASPRFDEALKKLGLGEEKRQEIVEQVMNQGSCQNIKEIPQAVRDTFVVSADITADEHVRTQAALQSFVDNSLSKTVNFHENATEEDVAKVYMMAWELGCKGITVYVTGSRDIVVLETKATADKKAPQPALDVAPAETLWHGTKKPRPRSLTGRTFTVETPVGKAFITINENGGEQPFEAFINTAKAGSEIAAVSEAIGRLVSYILRMASPVAPLDRMREIVRQLSGIGGGRSLGFGINRVRSLPDGIGQVLDQYLREKDGSLVEEVKSNGNGHHDAPMHSPMKIGDICPECGEAAVVNEEGCRKCYACGFSEC
jgi:ribonucleoside-diphosphate reductase alpha chain